MRLGDFVMSLMVEAAKMRETGATKEDIQRGLHTSLLEYAHAHGLVMKDSDIPPWFLRACGACNDSGWVETTRLVRGEAVEAYRRCSCRPQGGSPLQDDRQVAAKVSAGWKQLGRR